MALTCLAESKNGTEEIARLTAEGEEQRERIKSLEEELGDSQKSLSKKETLYVSFQKKIEDLLNEKQALLDQVDSRTCDGEKLKAELLQQSSHNEGRDKKYAAILA